MHIIVPNWEIDVSNLFAEIRGMEKTKEIYTYYIFQAFDVLSDRSMLDADSLQK